jgi:hypothetical protein
MRRADQNSQVPSVRHSQAENDGGCVSKTATKLEWQPINVYANTRNVVYRVGQTDDAAGWDAEAVYDAGVERLGQFDTVEHAQAMCQRHAEEHAK